MTAGATRNTGPTPAGANRVEDTRFLSGHGRFVDDIVLPGMAHMTVLRSPHAHARIESIDLEAVRAVPGVLDAFSARDLPEPPPEIPIRLAPLPGTDRHLQPCLATGTVRYAGEPVAAVVATDRYIAEDALDFAEVDYAQLPVLASMDAAAGDESRIGTAYDVGRGDIEAAFARADYTRTERFASQRQTAAPMETRGLIADAAPTGDGVRLYGATKVTFFNRRWLARTFGLPEEAVELIVGDSGGGFGVRGELYPEDWLTIVASRRIGRPVKWIEDRREHLIATNHSREMDAELTIAAQRDGTILGLKASIRADMGAYIRTNGGVVPAKAAQFLPGPYDIPAFACHVTALMTNKTPVGTYRGPGRIEANFFRERMFDLVAADLDLDPAAFRRKNLIRPERMPYVIGTLVPGDREIAYDSGDYPKALESLLAACDYDRWKTRQGTVENGRRMGLGIACFNESSGGGLFEMARISVSADGTVEVNTGNASVGQGVETAMAKICAESLGLDWREIRVHLGTTSLLPDGTGSFHSRSVVMGGNAVKKAADTLIADIRRLAAHILGVSADSVEYASGLARSAAAPGRVVGLAELSLAARAQANSPDHVLSATARYEQVELGFSYGGHAALVAIDEDTGDIAVEKYWVVEDVGKMLDENLVRAQAIGGVAQGLGGALFDHLIYDAEGQLLTGSFADYLLPTSTEMPEIVAITTELSPSPHNPAGYKGAGEGGMVAVAAAVGNAVAQALGHTGATFSATPFTPESVRAALRNRDRRQTCRSSATAETQSIECP